MLAENHPDTNRPSALSDWFHRRIHRAAGSLAFAGAASPVFPERVAAALTKNPIRDWEAERWMRGLKLRLVKMEDYFIRVGTGKRSAISLFVRNEKGLNVGLRRETITQMATYISLITDYAFPRGKTRFETGWMDVAVFDDAGRALIYAENKASEKTLSGLCERLSGEFSNRIPFAETDSERRPDDPVMKAQHIWRNRPNYFWAISPGTRRAFDVDYGVSGFKLKPIPDIPNADRLRTTFTF